MKIERPNVSDPGRIMAHRGASYVAPENSLRAFRLAWEQGAWWIEFDVSLLGDGTPVVHHDPTLERLSHRDEALSEISVTELSGIEVGPGEALPTLQQTLDLVDDLGLFANLEIKSHVVPDQLIAEVVAAHLAARAWSAERVIVSSFSNGALEHLRTLMPDQPLAVLVRQVPEDWAATVDRLAAAALHVRFDYLSAGLIHAARRRGVDVRTFTVNDPLAAAPFRDSGLTGIITDHPPVFFADTDWNEWHESR